MRTYLKTLFLVGLGAIQILATVPGVNAADLAVKRGDSVRVFHHKRAAVHIVHRRSIVVRDYDGTPIVLRRRTIVVHDYDGTAHVIVRSEATPIRAMAQPSRYINGQPVLPYCPRSWPRAFCSRRV